MHSLLLGLRTVVMDGQVPFSNADRPPTLAPDFSFLYRVDASVLFPLPRPDCPAHPGFMGSWMYLVCLASCCG